MEKAQQDGVQRDGGIREALGGGVQVRGEKDEESNKDEMTIRTVPYAQIVSGWYKNKLW